MTSLTWPKAEITPNWRWSTTNSMELRSARATSRVVMMSPMRFMSAALPIAAAAVVARARGARAGRGRGNGGGQGRRGRVGRGCRRRGAAARRDLLQDLVQRQEQ